MSEGEPVVLNEYIMRSFSTVRSAAGSFPISSMDFYETGSHLITSSAGSLCVYDMSDGERQKKVLSQKFNTDLVKWTHHSDTVVYSSDGGVLRYLSLFDNKHIRYYEGHTDTVKSLDLNPVSDMLASGAADKTVRFWEVSSQDCVARMDLGEHATQAPFVAFDPDGIILAVATAPYVRLYNLRQLGCGPFKEFNLEASIRDVSAHKCQGRFNPLFTSCKFDPTGKYILVATNQGLTLVMDSVEGQLKSVLGYFEMSMTHATEASFSPDSKYVLRGFGDGSIVCWNRETAGMVKTWEAAHPGPVRCLKFNPSFLTFASSCRNLNLWLPNMQEANRAIARRKAAAAAAAAAATSSAPSGHSSTQR